MSHGHYMGCNAKDQQTPLKSFVLRVLFEKFKSFVFMQK